MNNKTLLLILVVLVAVYGLSRLFSGKKEATFSAELIKVDTAAVSSITIDPRGEEAPFTLKKEGEQWIATREALSIKASQSAVQSLLGNLALIKTKHIAAKSKEKWAEYQVADTSGTRVQIFTDGGKLAEDFKVSSMPSSYVLDKDGKPRFKHKGFHLDKQSQYETELNSLLKN